MALTQSTIAIIKSTVPLLRENGVKITSTMYKNMFTNYPVVKNYFNNSHVRPGKDGKSVQAAALGSAVLAYAENIDNLGALGPAVENMVEKHVSFHVLPDHYEVVATCLIGAMKEVLGENVVNEEVTAAWGEAYWFLANLLIDKEKQVREARMNAKGGWEGYQPFVITKKVKESDKITSFYLKNAGNLNAPILDFRPGQYLSLKIPKGTFPEFDHDLVRNYSISSKPGDDFFRISVKREDEAEPANDANGVVSNYLHNETKIGTNLLIGVPCGVFVLDTDTDRKHSVLISAGVGITPLVSMLENFLVDGNKDKKVTLIQSVQNPGNHPLKDRIEGLAKANPNFNSFVFYTKSSNGHDLNETKVFNKRIGQEDLASIVGDISDCVFYFCGPDGFQKHVNQLLVNAGANGDQIRHETFGPGSAV